MTDMRRIAAIMLLLGASFATTSAAGVGPLRGEPPWRLAAAGETKRVTSSEAAERARAEHGGKVLSVNLVQGENGEVHYRVKLLQDGSVRVVRVPAAR